MLLKIVSTILRNQYKQVFLNFRFSQTQKTLKIKKQTAHLSLDLINMALPKNIPQQRNLHSPSLYENMISHIQQKQDYEEESKKAVLSLFKGGIRLDDKLFQQNRIKQGKVAQNNQLLFTFYPTYLVTTQIFQKIMNAKIVHEILQGQYGISKTVSVILFWHFAKFIDDYRFSEGAQITPEMLEIPKLFYLSALAPSEDSPKDQVKQILLKQIPEITKRLGKCIFQTKQKIHQFYQKMNPVFKDLNIILVLDQINSVAKFYQMLLSSTNKPFSLIDNQQIYQYLQQMYKTLIFLRTHIKLIIHLSSMNLQKDFAARYNLSGSVTHSQTLTLSILYSTIFFQKETGYDLINYFLFEMENRIFKDPKIVSFYNPKVKKIIKQKCMQIIQRQKPQFYMTLLDIRQFIIRESSITNKQRFISLKINSQQSFIKQTTKQFQDILEASTYRYKQYLSRHFQKDDDKDKYRQKIAYQIFNYLAQMKKQNSLQHQKKQNKSTTSQLIDQIPFDKLNKIPPKQIKKFADKRLFEINQTNLKLLLPSDLILKALSSHFIYAHFDYILNKIQEFLSESHRQGQYGYLIQNLLLLALNHGKQKKVQLRLPAGPGKDIFESFQFKQHSIYGFLPLQCHTGKINFIKILQPSLLEMIQNDQVCGIILPMKKSHLSTDKNQQQQRFLDTINSKSKCIDAIFVKFVKNMIDIWAIDFTTSKKETKDKIQQFTNQFMSFQDRKVDSIQINQISYLVNLNYVVLGPTVAIQQDTLISNLNNSEILKTHKEKIKFSARKTKSNFLSVQKKYLLKYVGCISFQNDFNMTSDEMQALKKLKSTLKTSGIIQKSQKDTVQ